MINLEKKYAISGVDVIPEITNDKQNVLVVSNKTEVFFDVFECTINGKKILVEKIDEVNEFNQAIYLSEDFIQVIKEIREIINDDLITEQDCFISRIEEMEEELDERKEISFEELEEIAEEISDMLREIELDI